MARVRVTHPFHPWAGRELEFVKRRRNWRADRVYVRDRMLRRSAAPLRGCGVATCQRWVRSCPRTLLLTAKFVPMTTQQLRPSRNDRLLDSEMCLVRLYAARASRLASFTGLYHSETVNACLLRPEQGFLRLCAQDLQNEPPFESEITCVRVDKVAHFVLIYMYGVLCRGLGTGLLMDVVKEPSDALTIGHKERTYELLTNSRTRRRKKSCMDDLTLTDEFTSGCDHRRSCPIRPKAGQILGRRESTHDAR